MFVYRLTFSFLCDGEYAKAERGHYQNHEVVKVYVQLNYKCNVQCTMFVFSFHNV